MPFNNSPPPISSPLTEVKRNPLTGETIDTGIVSQDWIQWFNELKERQDRSAEFVGGVKVPPVAGTIPLTPIPLPPTTTGLYRLSYYVRITTAATTSSSLTVRFTWTEGGVTRTATAAALTTNTVQTSQSGQLLIRADPATFVSYDTLYASNAANQMQYALDITVEGMA